MPHKDHQPTGIVAGAKPFHITIGSGPLIGEIEAKAAGAKSLSIFRLEHELLLVKAALLYGDRAKLYSPFMSLILPVLRASDLPLEERLELWDWYVARHSDNQEEVIRAKEDLRRYKKIVRKRYPNNKQVLNRQRFEQRFDLSQVQAIARHIASEAGADGIMEAVTSGVLDYHRFRASYRVAMENTDIVVEEFLDRVGKAVSDGSTYPLFDADLGGWIGENIQEGKLAVRESAISRGKHIGLAAQLLQRLPVFDMATIDEILDIRRELERPLTNFRAKIIEFAERARHEPWDEDFPFDVEQVFNRDVAPTVLAIEDAAQANSLRDVLRRKIIDKPLVVPGASALGVMLSSLSFLPALVSSAAGTGAASALVAYDAYKEWQQKQRTIEQNQLYFYYKAGKQLQALP